MSVAARGAGHAELMDAVYRRQRHFYDATRKYYLFGRDRLLRDLDVPESGSVLEIGCGTGRNLALVRRIWPDAALYGIDISAEMLRSAHARNQLYAVLALADAATFDAGLLLGRRSFDRVIMPYCLSMIPDWQDAVVNACGLLSRRGSLHIVDFGTFDRLPSVVGMGLRAWLDRFHVTPRTDLCEFIAGIAAPRGLTCSVTHGPGGYYQAIVVARVSPAAEA